MTSKRHTLQTLFHPEISFIDVFLLLQSFAQTVTYVSTRKVYKLFALHHQRNLRKWFHFCGLKLLLFNFFLHEKIQYTTLVDPVSSMHNTFSMCVEIRIHKHRVNQQNFYSQFLNGITLRIICIKRFFLGLTQLHTRSTVYKTHLTLYKSI